MNARVALGLVWLVMLSGCSVHFYAGTGTAPAHERTEERHTKKRYRVSYRTQETPASESIQKDEEKKREEEEKSASFHKGGKGRRYVGGMAEQQAGQQPANPQQGSGQTTGGQQSGGQQSGGQQNDPVVAQPNEPATIDDDTVEGRKRKHVLTDQERIAELAEQKKEEIRRKEEERKARMKRAAEAATQQQP